MAKTITSLLILPVLLQLAVSIPVQEIMDLLSSIEFQKPISQSTFTTSLFNSIASKNTDKNVILSPFSIQAALTLLYMGAEGATAEELRTGLQYKSSNKLENAESIAQILNSKSDGLVQLKIANRIYTGYELAPKFNEIAQKYFKSKAERVNFAERERTIQKINDWVERKTNKTIVNLLGPKSVSSETSAILVNAIYFKAKWADQFSKYATYPKDFWLSPTKREMVDTMSSEISCKYGEFPEFDATAIELPYEDNSMALLVILPNQKDGLRALEEKLLGADLTLFSTKMNKDEVLVELPKFKIEFDTGLIPIFNELGMQNAFSRQANYSGIFKTRMPTKISDVVHKAYINVNEYGSEASAATYIKTVPLSATYNLRTFTADHPFVFAIKNDEAVYFVGHIVSPQV